MTLTDSHAKYFAHELTKRCASDSMEKLAGAVAGAQVDLNPHQVDAALFAFNSPPSKGALLADEVGLGKTIEAGLVLSQRWAERKRRILVIVPANLRKQWYQELNEKFFLPCQILETKSYNAAVKVGNFRPLETKDTIGDLRSARHLPRAKMPMLRRSGPMASGAGKCVCRARSPGARILVQSQREDPPPGLRSWSKSQNLCAWPKSSARS